MEKKYEERLSNVSLMLRKAYVSYHSLSNLLFHRDTNLTIILKVQIIKQMS